MPRRSTPNDDDSKQTNRAPSAEPAEPERPPAAANSAVPGTAGTTENIGSTASAEPADPSRSAVPAGTTDPSLPTDPAATADLLTPADAAGTTDTATTTELPATTAPPKPDDSAGTTDRAKPTETPASTGPATPTELPATTAPVQPDDSTAATDNAKPTPAATNNPLGSARSTVSADSVSSAATLVTAGPTESAGAAAEPADTAAPAGARRPAAAAGNSAAAAYGSPVAVAVAVAHTANPPAENESAADPVSGPTGGAPLPPPSALGTPEYPRPPAATARRHLIAYPAGVLPAAAVTGLVAAATIPLDRPGIGWLLTGSTAAAAVGVVHRRARRAAGAAHAQAPNRERLWWTIAALALLTVGTFRAAGWLFVLCVAAAAVAGSLAVVGRRSERGVFRDALAVPLASIGAVAWVYNALGKRPGSAGARTRRLGVSAAVTVALLAMFVPLLAGADATFAALVDGLVPRMDGDTVTRWVLVFVWAGIGTLGALYLLAGPPLPADGQQKSAKRTLARLEWGLPVGALTAVFALFLGAQLVALFGGDDYVQRTAGLTYAEYARSGFWQLSAVTVLTLAVILPVLHRAARDTAVDRLWLRGLLCAISGLTLVMIASALGRMWTYQQAYGFTVLRLLVGTCELWLGIVYVLVIIAVLRLETAWLPRSAIATGTAALLALAALNPEGLVATENIDRWERGEDLDIGYLAGLSVDIVPALDRLPAPMRNDLLDRLDDQLDDDTWNSWNLARTRAR